jgi:hypothetical protein
VGVRDENEKSKKDGCIRIKRDIGSERRCERMKRERRN